MRPNVSLGYVGVEVNDPDALGDYLGSILGLPTGAPTSEGAHLTGELPEGQRGVE